MRELGNYYFEPKGIKKNINLLEFLEAMTIVRSKWSKRNEGTDILVCGIDTVENDESRCQLWEAIRESWRYGKELPKECEYLEVVNWDFADYGIDGVDYTSLVVDVKDKRKRKEW